ncbi:MAG TPA: ATPase domain-containing protein [Pirellulaceae bacterium]|nr:ATPase domain-containing protein [Pirellulaceae bacterium]
MTTPEPDRGNGRDFERVQIDLLPTGVPGLDEILGGGLPEFSFNILAGAPGCGKTTLAHQIMFANASQERPALYFTVLGEPAVKMLRYQQQFSFFDFDKVDGAIRFINLSQTVLEKELGAVLDEIVKEVEAADARLVVVDSFRTVVRRAQQGGAELELQGFIQRLALHLTSWHATSFLLGEYVEGELRDNPVFTVADGLLWLYQSIERNSIVRKMQIMKLRGQASVTGMHTFRITEDGVQAFPRTFGLSAESGHVKGQRRVSIGVPALDAMLGGGIPEGESLLLAGPSGSGKSTLGMQFIAEGLAQGEPGIVAIFEELPQEHIHRAKMFGIDFDTPQKDGQLKLIYLRPLDLSVDETVHEIIRSVKEIGARRLVIDSLVGFEMALAPGFREDFRESLYRMIAALTRLGVTIVSTVEIEEDFTSMTLSKFTVSFLADDIVRMRYVSINGQLRKMLMVIKMRRSQHSIDMVEYQITDQGVVLGEPLRGYRGLTSGIPQPWSVESGQQDPSLRQGRPTAVREQSQSAATKSRRGKKR